MKKLLIVLLLFICTGCVKHTSDVPVNEEKTLIEEFGSHLKLVRIGNHQYIKYYGGNRGSLCHYEDCNYCKQHRGY